MTKRQAELMAFLRERAGFSEITPSYAEMAAHLGLTSKAGVHRMIVALEAIGKVRRVHGTARSIQIVNDGDYARGYREGFKAAMSEFSRTDVAA